MAQDKNWFLISYDIRDPKRWRKTFKKLKGLGDHLQYSVFRVRMNKMQIEKLRWELAKILADEDDLLIIRLCSSCAQRVIDSRGDKKWKKLPKTFEVF